jgi:hypothetical protein
VTLQAGNDINRKLSICPANMITLASYVPYADERLTAPVTGVTRRRSRHHCAEPRGPARNLVVGQVPVIARLRARRGERCQLHLAILQTAIAIIGIYAASAGEATPPAASRTPVAFHIPAQPLAAALQTYGEAAGVQVLYESNSAVGRTSAAVDGTFTPEQALTVLLNGTELKVQYIRPDTITLALRSAAPDALSGGRPSAAELSLGTLRVRATGEADDSRQLHDYSDGLQADIQKVLQKNAATRGGNYRATLDLWIDQLRTVQRIDLVRSTGSESRDIAVAAALRGITISRPTPAGTPQPVRVVIVVRSMQ